MPLNWIDVTRLSFNSLLLLERVQLSWFPGWLPEPELAIALQANPVVGWYLRHKCPEIEPWLDQILATHPAASLTGDEARQAELKVMATINDLLVYAIDPSIYDAQPFMGWDSDELRTMADFAGQVVIDVGSGTGRLAFVAAEKARVVFAVEPVANLRGYLKSQAKNKAVANVYAVDGLITDLPFPSAFAGVTMSGHVFGDHPQAEYAEMARVTKPGGMVLFCPGSSMEETQAHEYLLSQGFACAEFEEPTEGPKRKYWKRMPI